MSDGSLSQDEIDALLQGSDTIEMESAIPGTAVAPLSDQEKESFGTLLQGVVESQSSNLSMLTGKGITIEAPKLDLLTPDQLTSELPDEVVEIKIDFTEGISGSHSYLMSPEAAIKIASLMLGQEGIELDEMALSTLSEAISNITGPTVTNIGNVVNRTIQVGAPAAKQAPKGEIGLPTGDVLLRAEYPISWEGESPSSLVEIFQSSVVKQAASMMGGAGGGEQAGGLGPQAPGARQTFGQPLGGIGLAEQAPPPNVQPVQFANLQSSSVAGDQGNIGLLMDVFMEMTVELGRTKKPIKEILTIGEGTIIELDKLAGEPVDILVNHKLIAKGEVVVIDENFGVRVTEIVSPMDRMSDLT
jgi:flagellar motor switch protein FliN/FliY